ncbi:MAG: hypothetical protein ACE5GM_07155 [bacterium]
MAVAEEPFILGPKNEEEYDAFFRLLERGTDFSLAFVFCDDKSIEAEIRRRLTVHYPSKSFPSLPIPIIFTNTWKISPPNWKTTISCSSITSIS